MIYKVALMWVETLALWEARHRPSHEPERRRRTDVELSVSFVFGRRQLVDQKPVSHN